jgi:hypothetical protein
MRRPLNWFVVLVSCIFLFTGLSLSGCGGSGSATTEDPPAVNGMLRQVRHAAELESALKQALKEAIAAGLPSGPVSLPDVSTTGFSNTYTVEAGVDELDVVRYDGTHLFVAPTYMTSNDRGDIRILRTDPANATATLVGAIPLGNAALGVMGMYVEDGHLMLITAEAYFGEFGDLWTATSIWVPTNLTVQAYDVRDPAQPRKLLSAVIEGVFVASRRVGDRVVLVSRHAPQALLDENERLRIAGLSLAELLPAITIDGRESPLVDPTHCYITNDDDSSGHAVITTITTFSLANPRDIDGTCYDEPASGIYASADALYLSEPRYSQLSQDSTRIHKFSLQGARPDYVGSAEVPGAIYSGGQSDFRMNESDDLLRVMTTQWTNDPVDFADHRLFVLREKPGEHALEIVGRLPNDARPEEIGKPNENLYGVRFVGDRAYAVTFQRIDPLYVIDLSTPADPRIAGQLLLPGWSEFLHPVTDDLLLGLGSDGSRFKLELFDTTVLEQPQSRGVITLGAVTSHSPALYDRHAFTYLAGSETDSLAVPASLSEVSPIEGQGYTWSSSLYQFEILGKQSASSALLREAGQVSPPNPADGVASVSRAFIDGDAVYYVRDSQVYGTFWETPSQVNGPF